MVSFLFFFSSLTSGGLFLNSLVVNSMASSLSEYGVYTHHLHLCTAVGRNALAILQ